MKHVATLVLKTAIIFMGMGVLALSLLLLPSLWSDVAVEFGHYAYSVYAVFLIMFVTVVPFFFGLYGAWRLLAFIDKGMSFTKQAASAVRLITYAAGVISMLYVISLPFFYIWADNDDAPGLVVIGIVLVGVPMVIAVFAALLQHLINEAATLKSENELTV